MAVDPTAKNFVNHAAKSTFVEHGKCSSNILLYKSVLIYIEGGISQILSLTPQLECVIMAHPGFNSSEDTRTKNIIYALTPSHATLNSEFAFAP